ncbi:hypothetical protein D3C71_2159450 [compost metagenome]
MACRSPQHIKPQQFAVNQHHTGHGMGKGRHAANGEPGACLHKFSVCPADLAHQRLDFALIDTAVA